MLQDAGARSRLEGCTAQSSPLTNEHRHVMNEEGSYAHSYAINVDVCLGSKTSSIGVQISHLHLSSERQKRQTQGE